MTLKTENAVKTFTEIVVSLILQIPKGKVCSYGEIARAAGNPRAARQVVRVLATQSQKYDLPWHRVVNKAGKIALPGAGGLMQRALLEAEGVKINENNDINLEVFAFSFQALDVMMEKIENPKE